MASLPTGTVTYLFTDVEGSTRLWELHPTAMAPALTRHDEIIEGVVQGHGGAVVRPRGEGDSRFAVFARATDAVAAAAAVQRALHAEAWPTPAPLRVRMALHTGEADLRAGDYYGTAVNRCARLRAAAHGGQTLLSQAAHALVRDQAIPDVEFRDLGEHRLKDLAAPERVYQLVVAGLPADFPPLATLDSRPHNLPVQRDHLIGREQALTAVSALMRRAETGLLTLTGPGGVGKTRLALQVAAELLDDVADGVWLVPLAAVRDATLVAPAIAQALGVRESAERSLVESLRAYLRDRQLLLVLDNFEQVADAAPLVGELLAAAPRLRALVTSRAALRLRGEQEYPVAPLALPDPARLPPTDDLARYGAMALFLHRARLARPDFALTERNARAIAGICARLDGLPLAIELAAARVKLLAPEALLERLGDRLRLLTGGPRDLPERQQTLRGAIGWSYDLLDPHEQRLFRRLAVFAGGCTLSAAEAVCGPDLDVLDGLSSLVDRSLVRGEATDDRDREPRYVMLETIREYATERLEESGEADALRRRHAEYCLGLAENWERVGHRVVIQLDMQQERLGGLVAELANLRAALAWALERDTDLALRLCGALSIFWLPSGNRDEGGRWLGRALALPGAAAQPAYADALFSDAMRLWVQGDVAAARPRLEQVVAFLRDRPDHERRPELLGRGLGYLAAATTAQEGASAAREMGAEGRALLHAAGDEPGLGEVLLALGAAHAFRGELAEARPLLEEGLALWRRLGGESAVMLGSIMIAGIMLADTLRMEGDAAGAARLYEERLAVARELGARGVLPGIIHSLGHAVLAQGEVERARALFAESLALARELEDRGGVAEGLAGFAAVAAAEGRGERATRLLAAATAHWEAHGLAMWPAERAEYERTLARARARLDEQAWQRAWEEGRAMTVERAVAETLEPG